MSFQIIAPTNQVRLTNVAVVRLSRGGHRFEVACYRNKIINYRQGTETDLSEVLQTERIFTNVSKGQFANSKILLKCFDTSNEEEVCRFILDKGDVQVSDQERAAQLESTNREVASMVCEKCVDPVSRRPYSVAQVRDAMKAAAFMVHPTRNTKQQFLDCVKLLQKKNVLDIERAKMQLALVLLDIDSDASDNLERRNSAIDLLMKEGVARSDILPPKNDDDTRIIFQSDPSLYRQVDGIARDSAVQGRLEIIQQCVTEEGDVTLGSELERRVQQQQHNAMEEEEARNKSLVENKEVDASSNFENDIQSLSNNFKSNLTVKESAPSDDDDHYDSHTTKNVANSRKAQKAAQKKSKKAKRREKEEQADRDQRIAAEKTRQKERAERLGLVDNSDAAGGNNGSENKTEGGGGDTKPCNTCGGAFTPGEYRSHFRSDWHRYNVKLKMKGVAAVCEREFLLCDSDAFFE
mmetsp:Transcript_8380/g.18772  ORF Transcript_8380/g.18772 Transcript_8380/m.18772 type:complete len:465 (-) Transcript_8380:232-1626(-)|eukprot:CAMPEP_0172318036 /NCGR_PEP_ID=MMETSP1058-20130122/33714_1 /TAXON_ID=83371 /ORGANISM="Detonula confervacea, Strain CCMP 353" /LENGTH=464 /DNA_ID=CAMNT_0013032759 /DNA_START=156 /DNA_END=1550 /DNA_ORIENTATION=-